MFSGHAVTSLSYTLAYGFDESSEACHPWPATAENGHWGFQKKGLSGQLHSEKLTIALCQNANKYHCTSWKHHMQGQHHRACKGGMKKNIVSLQYPNPGLQPAHIYIFYIISSQIKCSTCWIVES